MFMSTSEAVDFFHQLTASQLRGYPSSQSIFYRSIQKLNNKPTTRRQVYGTPLSHDLNRPKPEPKRPLLQYKNQTTAKENKTETSNPNKDACTNKNPQQQLHDQPPCSPTIPSGNDSDGESNCHRQGQRLPTIPTPSLGLTSPLPS